MAHFEVRALGDLSFALHRRLHGAYSYGPHSQFTTTKEGILRKSIGLTLTLSAIFVVIGVGEIGQSFAQEMQRMGTTDTAVDKSVGREGGQSRKSPHLEKRSEASRSRGEGRIGGQSGTEIPLRREDKQLWFDGRKTGGWSVWCGE